MALRWINYHLRAYLSDNPEQTALASNYAVKDLAHSLADGVALTVLLHQISPPHAKCDLSGLSMADALLVCS